MQCQRCGTEIQAGRENEHLGQYLCEDCYMDTLSPVRTCDPWAVHSAKNPEAQIGEPVDLSDRQQKILEILKET